MGYHPITPFGRSADSVVTALRTRQATAAGAPCPADKWAILRNLATARAAFGLSDRDLTVLQALLSFHPEATLDPAKPLVVHPSNVSICDRAHGMACSTMRRHLARLVAAGLLARRDSPNGKRYARRIAGEKIAFGFDLRPLVTRSAEIAAAADQVRAQDERLRHLREAATLLRRDLAALAALGAAEAPADGRWDAHSDLARLAARQLRRKLDEAALTTLSDLLREAVQDAMHMLEPAPAELSTNAARIEQHHQYSEPDTIDSDPARKGTAAIDGAAEDAAMNTHPSSGRAARSDVNVAAREPEPHVATCPSARASATPPLRLVLSACPQIATYAGAPVNDWESLVRAADRVRPMTGISDSAWSDACQTMGHPQAAVVLAAMVERFAEIRNPGGYLRDLTGKARTGTFSALRMVTALANRAA